MRMGSHSSPETLGAQLGLALDNLQAVLDGAGMTLANVVRLNIFTTDVDAFFAQLGVLHARLQGATPPGTLLGVARLAYPELMIEIEATAVA
jgi:enamine deaminase RidA (YjgF/YER057c/UK114 family)